MTELRIGQKWRHKKRGSTYEIVCVDGAFQCSTYPDVEASLEDENIVSYRPINGFRLFHRIDLEFLDGRFELIEDVT